MVILIETFQQLSFSMIKSIDTSGIHLWLKLGVVHIIHNSIHLLVLSNFSRPLFQGFDEQETFYPSFLLFRNRTTSPHVIDQNFVVVEQSDETKRIRIGQGSAEGGALDNTIKFSISQGQSILDVQTIHGDIWIQDRLTIHEIFNCGSNYTGTIIFVVYVIYRYNQ